MFCTTRLTRKLIIGNRLLKRQILQHDKTRALVENPETLRCISFSAIRLCENRENSPHKEDGTAKGKSNTKYKHDNREEHPVRRVINGLGNEFRNMFSRKSLQSKGEERMIENKSPTIDVLVIGGGAIGSSIAYHLKEFCRGGLSVAVVEQDPSYQKSSTVLSVGGIRQQFSLPENICLSMYGIEFLKEAPELLAVEGFDLPNMHFNPCGYLTLASEAGMRDLEENLEIQREFGAKLELLSATKLKERFPWVNTDGIEAGVIGLENEGWFDPWSLLLSLRRKAVSLGAEFVTGKVTAINKERLDDMFTMGSGDVSTYRGTTVEILLPNGETKEVKFAVLIIAAGAWSGEVGRLAGIGEGTGLMGIPIPVEPRKRYVYCVHAPDGPGLDCPLVIDPNNTYFRREGLGGLYLCGRSPCEKGEPPVDNLDVDEEFFQKNVWPTIANRVPAFEKLKLQSSWAGYYDYNTFDQNGIVGMHPFFQNLHIAAGFSGHGIQQAPAVGRAITESIVGGEYSTIDLERLGFDRFLLNEPLLERNIV